MKKCCLILLFAGFFGLFLSSAHAENLNTVFPQYRASGPAMRDLTGAYARFMTQNSTAGLGKMNANTVQDLKVMAIRVEFVPDTSTATTGDGTFDLGASSDYFVDRPPHNRPYFSAQLQAVSHYFDHVSNSQLKLSGIENEFGDVFPLDSNSAYSLPHDMSYYGADDDDLIRERRLAELFQDAWTAADADPALDFSQYDIFVVFHAGVGGDIAFDFDTSPFDISSAFISGTDLGKQLANDQPGYAGIPVNDGSFHIPEGIVLPETQSQEEINFGMLGTAALMFGSQLGMPNLFNTETGAAGIGKWGLMDQGSGNFLGLIPAQPSAWTKLYMGWEAPVIISRGDQVPVAAALADNPNKIYKIIINANEYFLIENRQQHMLKSPDLAVGYDQNGVRVEMHRDYSFAQTATDDSFKVLVSVDEYDFDVPGSGILIWHIDEQLILEKLATNTINSDPDSRGVDLEEAHGSQDIGGTFGFLSAASGSENGIGENAFFAGNESNLLVNNANSVVFGPDTRPGSASNSRAESGIQLNNFSAIAPIMYFDLSNGVTETGFPQFIPETAAWTPNSLIIIDSEQDVQQEIFASSTDGTIYGWMGDGQKIIDNTDTFEKTQLNGSSDTFSLAVFAETGDSILTAPGYADLNGDQIPEIFVATASGQVFAWHKIDADVDGRADLVIGFPKNIDDRPTTAGMNLPSGIAGITGESVAWGLNNGSAVLISENNTQYLQCGDQPIVGLAFDPNAAAIFFTDTAGKMYRYQNIQMVELGSIENSENLDLQPVVGNFDTDADFETMLLSPAGNMLLFDPVTGVRYVDFQLNGISSQPGLADIDADGLLDPVYVAEDKLWAYHLNNQENEVAMSLQENFPLSLRWTDTPGEFPYAPVISRSDPVQLITGCENGDIAIFTKSGSVFDERRLSTGGAVRYAAALGQLDADDNAELAAISADNGLYVWELPYSTTIAADNWTGFLGDARHWALANSSASAVNKTGELLQTCYVYPNPAENDQTTLRFEVIEDVHYSYKIHDISGHLIQEMDGQVSGTAAIPNELEIYVIDLDSGIYLLTVEVTGNDSGNTQTRTLKLAVVR